MISYKNPQLFLQKSYFQIKSHLQVPEVRTGTYLSQGHNITHYRADEKFQLCLLLLVRQGPLQNCTWDCLLGPLVNTTYPEKYKHFQVIHKEDFYIPMNEGWQSGCEQ